MRFYEDLDKFADNTVSVDARAYQYTYRQLVEESDRFAARLSKNRKNLIFILCANNIESLAAYIGSLKSDNTAVLLSSAVDRELLANLIGLYRPDYIWLSDEAEGEIIYEFQKYHLIYNNVERGNAIYPDLALLLSTSGSTGSPKMVRLTGDNLDANASSIAEYLRLNADERPITSLPMYYSFGLSVINSHLKVGATILLTNDSIVTRPFWDFFNRYGATSFSGVPYTYEMLRRFKFLEMSLPSLRTMTQAGGKLTPKFAKEFAEFSRKKEVDFFIMYGQTEATARISYLPPEDNLKKYMSIGKAIPGGALSLIDGDGKSITGPGVDGELVYRGPNVMLGYAESEKDLGKGDELSGKLETGDIARFDEDGYFYITGRMKRFIKIFGNRINLDEIEHFLKSEGYNSICGGKDDLLCAATTDEGKAKEMKGLIVRKYGFHHSAVKVIEVEKILKSSSGKIQYEQMFRELLS
jgi:acyl-CoA synthetase (AMP-forming)/AMP-acid ligase II